MLIALVFTVVFFGVLFALVGVIGRGRSHTTITGPMNREMDYDSAFQGGMQRERHKGRNSD